MSALGRALAVGRAGELARAGAPILAPGSHRAEKQRSARCSAARGAAAAAAAAAAVDSPAELTEVAGQYSAEAASEAAAAVASPPPALADTNTAAVQPQVAFVVARTLPPQASLAAAVQLLRAAVLEVPGQVGAYASGLVRLEVPLPQGTKALWWLRGQPAAAADAASQLHPRIYFSPRRTTAADTEGSAAAGAASAGAASVAGAGAAWLWCGQPGQALGEGVVSDMQRFLSGAAAWPRIRAFGGTRFNAAQQPAGEWRDFGSYCFMIPRLEFLEASGCCILSCTVAWDACHPAATDSSSSRSVGTRSGSGAVAVGFASAGAATMDAVAALDSVQPPTAPTAGAFKLQRLGACHVPDEAGWHQLMNGTLAELGAAAAAEAAAGAAAAAALQEGKEGSAVDACMPMLKICPEVAREEYLLNGQEGLDDLLAALEGGFQATTLTQDGRLTKVVLARRTDVSIRGRLEPLALLEALQERDPRAYQLMLQMPSGACFLGSTPECLYMRTGAAVASEAVAGTRARGAGGDVEKDFWLAFDLLRSHKDHAEFTVVRDWVQQALGGVCEAVTVDVAKSVLKQGTVQHLYGKLSAQLKPGSSDAHLLAALHPTPAVCGRPREDAMGLLAASEPFDRGYYAGPFGWISHGAAEFVVAIRSALVQPGTVSMEASAKELQQLRASHAAASSGQQTAPVAALAGSSSSTAFASPAAPGPGAASPNTLVSLFAGVGIVRGSESAQEWAELDLKVRQYERLLQGVPPLAAAPNLNTLWARLLVEELCRLGCNTFCVAPGSRSSPLTVAVAQHPRARIVPCIDERSLGFWALGHSRATGRPAVVITSSGTAVANLLPAAVEASQSGVPLLLLTGDRPTELRDTGANQTIDQVKIFGGYARWHADLPAPLDVLPARLVLSAVDTAVQQATGLPAGPVHLNCQFREPLAPVEAGDWDRSCLQGLQYWEAGDAPFTALVALQTPAAAVVAKPAQPLLLPGLAAGTLGGGDGAAGASLVADPAARAALQAIAGARRGLVVAAELSQAEDVVAAAQLAQLLGWPMAADVLSGLRAGVAPGAGPGPAVIHHFDHLLLLDRQQWQQLRPDVVLQLGGHLTSKRTNQFLEWCCTAPASSGDNTSSSTGPLLHREQQQQQPLTWILADRSPKRHDQFHLLSHRLQAPLPTLAAAVAAHLAAPAPANIGGGSMEEAEQQQQQARRQQQGYCRLLQLLDGEASAAVDAVLSRMPELTEPQVARTLSQQLPSGEGLFVGNSMSIRDLDMYACPSPAASATETSPAPSTDSAGATQASLLQQGVVGWGQGAPVAANRGASGIDGILSTAAGFADGLGRGATLLVGDISFLHDINGLNLLRSGEARPPLTVVLVNNSGGGIFSFLPIAEALPEDVFTPLWATPQHVDLEGMCRAHGIPHQKVAMLEDLRTALLSAWSCNRHSVVEVVTSRISNVDRHRDIQAKVKQAVSSVLHLLEQQACTSASWTMAATVPEVGMLHELGVQSATYHAYHLPLAKPLTTMAAAGGEQQHRQGFLLRLSLVGRDGSSLAHGVGEVAPLPGLHAESLQQAEQQLALLCQLLGGSSSPDSSLGSSRNDSSPAASSSSSCSVSVPLTVALLGGRLGRWLRQGLGVAPEALLPSVRCGLEAALLSALAQHQGISLAQLLAGSTAMAAAMGQTAAAEQQQERYVAVNGLLNCQGSPGEAAAEAAALLHQHPYSVLKIKVGQRADPLVDAAAVLAIRKAAGPSVALRADANRRWSLEQAVTFGKAVAGVGLQYVEEPLAHTADLPELFRRTGLPLALDESVDEDLVGPWAVDADALCEGVVALVLKPAVLGGFERTLELGAWARRHGMRAVVSSSFETSLGIAQLAQLAAALDAAERAAAADGEDGGAGCMPHGLATLSWLAEDLLPAAGQALLGPHANSSSSSSTGNNVSHSLGMSLTACDVVVSSSVALVLGLDRQQQQQQKLAAQRSCTAGGAHAASYQQQQQEQAQQPQAQRRHCPVVTASSTYDFGLLEVLPPVGVSEQPPLLLLHGFLGTADDWLPLMHALGLQRLCIALDMPGHGCTTIIASSSTIGGNAVSSSNGVPSSSGALSGDIASSNGANANGATSNGSASSSTADLGAYSLEAAAEAVATLVEQQGLQGCLLAGYSLGGRLALLLAARWPHLFSGVACISGSPGPPGPAARAERAARDDALAAALRYGGLDRFLSDWYQHPMWAQLRASPRFDAMLQQRRGRGDARQLAAVLAAASPGRAPSLWQELRAGGVAGALPPLLLVAGQEDGKFVRVAEKLAAQVGAPSETVGAELVLLPGCGHAAHIERPVELLAVLQRFFDATLQRELPQQQHA